MNNPLTQKEMETVHDCFHEIMKEAVGDGDATRLKQFGFAFGESVEQCGEMYAAHIITRPLDMGIAMMFFGALLADRIPGLAGKFGSGDGGKGGDFDSFMKELLKDHQPTKEKKSRKKKEKK